jgi:FkbM family methyltransferase
MARLPIRATVRRATALLRAPADRVRRGARTRRIDEIVRETYRSLLGRDPDADELASWRRAHLARDVSAAGIVAAVGGSPERRMRDARALVRAAAGEALQREGVDLEALAARCAEGDPAAEVGGAVEAAFARRLVRALYSGILGREPGAEEGAYWAERVAGPEGWGVLVTDIVRSDEWQDHLAARLRAVGADVVIDFRVDPDDATRPPLRIGGPISDVTVVPSLIEEGEYEPHVARVLRRVLAPGDTAIDAGANIGATTLVMADAVGASGRVVAFEPGAEAGGYLRANLARNALEWVEPRPVGLWDRDEQLVLATPARALGASWVESPEAREDPGIPAQPLELRALDRMRERGELAVDALRLVKMDIEGAEPRALAGMRATLAELRPVILAECNPVRLPLAGSSPAELHGLLLEAGYRCWAIEATGDASGRGDVPEVLADLPLTELPDRAALDARLADLGPHGLLDLLAWPAGPGGAPDRGAGRPGAAAG